MRILPYHAVSLNYLGEAKGYSGVEYTSGFKQMFVKILSVLDSSLAKTKLFSLTFEMMHSEEFRATFLGSQCLHSWVTELEKAKFLFSIYQKCGPQ